MPERPRGLRPEGLPQAAGVALETPVFLIAFAVTAAVGLLVGFVPAFAHGDLKGGVPQGAWQAASSHHLTRRSLVIAEVAFALVLLVGAGLLFRSLQQLFAISPGLRRAQRPDDAGAGRRAVAIADHAGDHRFFRAGARGGEAGARGRRCRADHAAAAQRRLRRLRRADSSRAAPGSRRGWRRRVSLCRQRRATSTRWGFRCVAAGCSPITIAPARRWPCVISESFARRAISGRRSDRPARAHRSHQSAMVHDRRRRRRRQAGVARSRTWFDAVYMTAEQWHFADRARWFVDQGARRCGGAVAGDAIGDLVGGQGSADRAGRDDGTTGSRPPRARAGLR